MSCFFSSLKENIEKLTFEGGLLLAKEMLNNSNWDEELQSYSIDLLEVLRKKYSEKWNSDWKYDAFLGYAYGIILNYDKSYKFYKRAFDRAASPPPQLLVALAGCCWAPGIPPISEEEAIVMVKQALSSEISFEGANLLKGLYKSVGNAKEQTHWETILDEKKDTIIHLPSLDDVV